MRIFKPLLLLLLLPFLLLGLGGCQPKGTTLYQYPATDSYQIDNMIVVIDYLNLRDDIGKYWDFDSYYHQKILNQLLHDSTAILRQANYPAANSYLLTSGLLINHEFAVEHYINEVLQPDLLYPPFILAEQNIDESHLDQHQEILTLMVKYIAQRRHHETDELSHRGMQMAYHFDALDLPENTGVLYVHIDLSATGAIKQLGSLLISGAIASQADFAAVHLDGSYQRHASAFLVHHGSGQILWKNHSNSWTPDQPLKVLLTKIPAQQ